MKTILVLFGVFFFASAEEKVFEKLADLNEKWLRATSIPEASFLLKRPPYSYHSDFVKDILPVEAKNWSVAAPRGERSCGDDLIQIVSNIGSGWALQMLDSDGKLESGLLRGGVIWPGHFGECLDVYAPEDDTGRHGGFNGQYCVTSWTMNISKKVSSESVSQFGLALGSISYSG